MRSNVEFWKAMQDEDYFEQHPCYSGLNDHGDAEVHVIEQFVPLNPSMKVVVIGCGYGRETAHIAKRVKHVYGIDVNDRILGKAVNYLKGMSVTNFTPVLAESYRSQVPQDVDLVFSIVVMQHLTRDLVRDYLAGLGAKLSPQGKMVIQFLEDLNADLGSDAELKVHEPSVSWSLPQIVQGARDGGLTLERSHSYLATSLCLWHWVLLGRPAAQ
jgi:cyclopropane fatty-acyl-phospholipid synthase-like methyltransferase